jgi:serine/threonine protein kinase
MIAVDRVGESFVVSRRPGPAYRALTYALPMVALLAASVALRELLAGDREVLSSSAVLAAPLLLLLALMRGWTTTQYRFDGDSGLLVVTRSGPAQAPTTRQVPFASVSALIDRRSANGRAIELVLADRSPLVVARARAHQDGQLDGVVQRVSELLKKTIQFGQGVVVADRFEIDRLVQQGGMGAVYRALDRATGNPVALKLMLGAAGNREHAERFAREIELLAGLDHPRIARHVAHGSSADGRSFLAMQWLEGRDLASVLADGPLSLADSLRVLAGAAEAVAAVHGQGIIHRDLKPSNLFLRNGSAADLVLLDFGVARRLESKTRLTGSSALVGTPHYMAPEQASATKELLPAADIFALGCIFYECLTGTHPFEAPQLVGVLARILFDVPQPVRSVRPAVPEAWAHLLTRMLAKKAGDRPADAAALLRELEPLPAAEAERSAPAPLPAAPTPPDADDQVLVCVVLASPSGATLGSEREGDRFDSIRSAMDRFGCPIERLLDGSLLATVFPQPSATDLARIAARCAMYLREQLPEARIAVATGHASLRRLPQIGNAVDKATQLLDRAAADPASGIRLDTVTASLLEERFVTAADARSSLLLGEKADADAGRLLLGRPTPCVGRDLELLQLEGLAADAIEESRPQTALVIGPPGIGKSRLRHEFLRRLRDRYPDVVVHVGYGDPLSAGSPYVLLADALRRHAGIRVGDDPATARAAIVQNLCRSVEPAQLPRVSEFLGELCGVPFPVEESPRLQAARGEHRVMSEQIALAFVDWLASECAAQPLLLVLEDVQWGDTLTLKVLEAALRDLRRGAFFVIALGRPEAAETFPNLLGAHRALSLSLKPLSNKAGEALIKNALGDDLGAEPLARMLRLASGNALFLEELIRAAADGKAGDVPETVLAMLQARLSRLTPEARLVLRAASVLGETFWRGGVQRICATWGSHAETEALLAQLVDVELLEPLRNSRFSSETQFGFRHALVCDAAHGLLNEVDRRSGHLAASFWLEAVGEPDCRVLARHAEEGGDEPRAVAFYTHAAEQSLGQHDFAQALACVAKATERGAAGEALGALQCVRASAFYGLGHWQEAARAGLEAIEQVPRGGALWCSTVEALMQVLPNINDLRRYEELSNELLQIVPSAEASTAHVRALSGQLLGAALSGARARGQACLSFIDTLGPALLERDVVARGYTQLWRGVFTTILGDDLELSLSLARGAIRDLSECQILYRLSLAYVVEAFALWGVGQFELSEQAARQAREVAVKIHDGFHTANASWYIALTLSEHTGPAQLDQAERCALEMVELQQTTLFEATSHNLTARVALARRDWKRAEADARSARTGMSALLPYRFLASSSLLTALVQQSRAGEAAALANEELALFEHMGSPVFSEVIFRVAAAEALFAGGQRSAAEGALREALRQIERRAAKLSDPTHRASYLTARAENRRAAELARSWRIA